MSFKHIRLLVCLKKIKASEKPVVNAGSHGVIQMDGKGSKTEFDEPSS